MIPCSPNFSDVLAEETDEKAIEFAMGGLCNCCAGMYVSRYAVSGDWNVLGALRVISG